MHDFSPDSPAACGDRKPTRRAMGDSHIAGFQEINQFFNGRC